MKSILNKNNIIIIGIAIFCMILLRALGFGFGNETWLTEQFGFTFLGSDVYMGTWFIFMMMVPVGVGIPLLVIRYIFHESIADYGFKFGKMREGILWLMLLFPAYVLIPLGSAYFGTEYYYDYLIKPEFVKPINIAIHCISYAVFVFGFEFLYRGFVLFGLKKNSGDSLTGKWVLQLASQGYYPGLL